LTAARVKTFVQRVLLITLSGFLIWQSGQLVSSITGQIRSASAGSIAIESILLNLFITGIFLVGYALPIHRLLPDSYYTSVKSKSFASACAILRVESFRKVVRLTFWGARSNKRHFFNGKRNGFAEFERNTRISESGHTLAFVAIALVSIYIGAAADPILAIATTLVNVVFNFYPAVLQRCHRLRLQAIIE
jgi:hypothetical protein